MISKLDIALQLVLLVLNRNYISIKDSIHSFKSMLISLVNVNKNVLVTDDSDSIFNNTGKKITQLHWYSFNCIL